METTSPCSSLKQAQAETPKILSTKRTKHRHTHAQGCAEKRARDRKHKSVQARGWGLQARSSPAHPCTCFCVPTGLKRARDRRHKSEQARGGYSLLTCAPLLHLPLCQCYSMWPHALERAGEGRDVRPLRTLAFACVLKQTRKSI
jgi:hypothetical protein